MTRRVVRVLTFEGCPHADSARAAARTAVEAFAGDVEVREVDLLDPAIPAALRGFPSPTILVGMDEVSPRAESVQGAACRTSGAPSVEEIRAAMRAAWGRGP
ncbi:MAG: hypothetical protein ACF8NJ_11160 [Phycisphaerales bacterium JB038]